MNNTKKTQVGGCLCLNYVLFIIILAALPELHYTSYQQSFFVVCDIITVPLQGNKDGFLLTFGFLQNISCKHFGLKIISTADCQKT